jgi:hypothetical protein|tara:strand:- start:105 stop:341 length:237 start_codon:yes stop_codon:yes gene_type:complete
MSLDRIVFTLDEYMFFGQNGGKQHSFPEGEQGAISRFKEQVKATGNSIVATHREQDTQRWTTSDGLTLGDDDLTMKGW